MDSPHLQIEMAIKSQSDLEGLLAIHGSAFGYQKFGGPSELINKLLVDLEKGILPIVGPEGWTLHQGELNKQFRSLEEGNSMSINKDTNQPEFKMKFN